MTKLTPTQVTEATMGDALFDGVRRRPVVAIDDNGKLVVCCRRTAKVNGWTVQASVQRVRINKHGKLDTTDTPQRRQTDHDGAVVLSRDKVSAIKGVVSTEIDALLGK